MSLTTTGILTATEAPLSTGTLERVLPDEIVGAVAYEITKEKFMPLIQDPETNGALIILSGFTPQQLAGLIQSAEKEGDQNGKVRIQFPSSELSGYGIPEKFLVDKSAVAIRNTNPLGTITITCDTERDAGASLKEKDTTSADQLKDGNIAIEPWIKILSQLLNVSFDAETQKQIRAMMKGLFDCGRFTIDNLAIYLHQVLTTHHKGVPLIRAAGLQLPKLGLPLYEDCFNSLIGPKSGQPSQWGKRFEEHQKNEAFLDKRGPTGDLLDTSQLQKTLDELRGAESTPLPESLLDAFEKYIKTEGTRSTATTNLLYDYDWTNVRECFDTKAKTSPRKFAEETRKALEYQSQEISNDDESTLQLIHKVTRKSGSADEEIKKFFALHVDAITSYTPNRSLILDWEDFVYGRKITCEDFLAGILECLQRVNRLTTPGTTKSLIIEGVKQGKPANFEGLNIKACKYFERNFGRLEVHTKKLIRFETSGKGKTLLPVYSKEVEPRLPNKNNTNNSKSKNNKGFEFHITIYENEIRLTTKSLIWMFPSESVLAKEIEDVDALIGYKKKNGSPLALGLATYENVGKKGVPPTLCLHSVLGFGSSPGAKGRGSFIPKTDSIVSLYKEFTETLKDPNYQEWLKSATIVELLNYFEKFNKDYHEALLCLRKDALDNHLTWPMLNSFSNLMECVRQIENTTIRKKLIRTLLQIGIVTVAESSHRPPLAIVCPWNPQRMEATAARKEQILEALCALLTNQNSTFSDGRTGSLFFCDILELAQAPLQPEVAVVWDKNEATPMIVSQAVGGYTLHESPFNSTQASTLDNGATESSTTIMREVDEYLRLQPHQRDSLSILLYNCDSPDLPEKLVEDLNKNNQDLKDGKITCQVLLTHSDEQHLHELYKKLVAGSEDQYGRAEETSGNFLSKVRINITAVSHLFHEKGSRTQPADIAYCRDLLSHRAKTEWEWVQRQTLTPKELRPHQWNRTRPFITGDPTTKILLCCPAQTEIGWKILHAISYCCANGADDAWNANKCPVPIRTLNFDNKEVSKILEETHKLAVWVVNQDELLDRRILEDKNVRVIRYIQSTTQGRNLVISSTARETLLKNTLQERLRLLLPAETSDPTIDSMVNQIIDEANGISGGLVLKAARRANNTSELFGMVLSKYIVKSEIGLKQPAAWCFLDDFSHWLGKEEGTNIADLLVLAPTYKNGTPHLNIIVTEAKFINPDSLATDRSRSEKQLADTLLQITQALSNENQPLDQNLWLSRISDMILSRTTGTTGENAIDLEKWRTTIRDRKCSFSIWGYSHVFVHTATDNPIAECKGIIAKSQSTAVQGFQEVFDCGRTRKLLQQMHEGRTQDTKILRQQNGLPETDNYVVISLTIPENAQHNEPQEGNINGEKNNIPEGKTPLNQIDTILDMQGVAINMVSSTFVDPHNPSPKSDVKIEKANPDEPALHSPIILNYLKQRAELSKASIEAGQEWLMQTNERLRRALVQRGFSAITPDGFQPILTPNAAIVKFKGNSNMTTAKVEKCIDELYTSEGLRILNVLPEPGRVSFAIARVDRQVLHTPQVFLKLFQSELSDTIEEKVFVGIREEDGKPHFLNPYAQPHTLVAGATGSGKSVLMQNILLFIALSRTPDQTHIYLIDAKSGVDYIPLQFLPHLELGSGKIIDTTNDSLTTFKQLVAEMDRRYELFKGAFVNNCQTYREKTGKALPTLWIIHDEFADWMKIDEYSGEVTKSVDRLSIKARAAGIFLVFAAQRPDNTVMPMQLRSQLGNRLVLKVSDPGTAEIATGEKQIRAEKLLPKGHMLAKTDENFVYTQVPYIDPSIELPMLVQLIRLHHGLAPSKDLPQI